MKIKFSKDFQKRLDAFHAQSIQSELYYVRDAVHLALEQGNIRGARQLLTLIETRAVARLEDAIGGLWDL